MNLIDPNGMAYAPRDIEGITSTIYWLKTNRDQTIPALYFHNSSCKYLKRFKHTFPQTITLEISSLFSIVMVIRRILEK